MGLCGPELPLVTVQRAEGYLPHSTLEAADLSERGLGHDSSWGGRALGRMLGRWGLGRAVSPLRLSAHLELQASNPEMGVVTRAWLTLPAPNLPTTGKPARAWAGPGWHLPS